MKLDLKELIAKLTNTPMIVEEGQNNSWTYRKWSNGKYEAWQKYQATGLVMTTQSAGTYYGANKQLNLPSFNTAVKCVTYGNTTSQSSGVYIYSVEPTSGGQLTVNYRAHVSVSSGSCGGYFFIIGEWT